jgi:hypothetical protein
VPLLEIPISQQTAARHSTSPWDIGPSRATVAGMSLMIARGSSRVLEKDAPVPVTDAKKKGFDAEAKLNPGRKDLRCSIDA